MASILTEEEKKQLQKAFVEALQEAKDEMDQEKK